MAKYEPVGTVWKKKKESPLPSIIAAVIILFIIIAVIG